MADAAPSVMEGLPLFRNEFPCVFPRQKRELQRAKRVPVSYFTVRSGKAQEIVAAASRPSDNLADSIRRISFALGVLWRKSLVGMLVSGKNQAGVSGI